MHELNLRTHSYLLLRSWHGRLSTRYIRHPLERCFLVCSLFQYEVVLWRLLPKLTLRHPQHILRKAAQWGVDAKVVATLKYDIPRMYEFHTHDSKDIEVCVLFLIV
jgi:predicted RNA methylase